MQYRSFGKTDMQVSALSFGGSSLGGVFHAVDSKKRFAQSEPPWIDISPIRY